jgi:hypothetical protein
MRRCTRIGIRFGDRRRQGQSLGRVFVVLDQRGGINRY